MHALTGSPLHTTDNISGESRFSVRPFFGKGQTTRRQ